MKMTELHSLKVHSSPSVNECIFKGDNCVFIKTKIPKRFKRCPGLFVMALKTILQSTDT